LDKFKFHVSESWTATIAFYLDLIALLVSYGVQDNKRIAPLSFCHGCRKKAAKGLIAFTPEIDCDQTAVIFNFLILLLLIFITFVMFYMHSRVTK
jgi:hypothetical protein